MISVSSESKLVEAGRLGQSRLDLSPASANIIKGRSCSRGSGTEHLPQIHEARDSISSTEKNKERKNIYNNQEGFYIVFEVTYL